MPLVDKSVLVPYASERMFALVQNIPDYPKFLPWCGGAQILEVVEGGTIATLLIDFKGIRQSFTTINRHDAAAGVIEMRLRDGPFKSLNGTWRFLPLMEDACKVQLNLQYEFSSRILEAVVGPVFNGIAKSFMDAFIQRAEAVYG